MQLEALPNELIIRIAKALDDDQSISAFSRSSKRFYRTVNFVLYIHNVEHNSSSALLWAAGNNQIQTARYSIERGACLDVQDEWTRQTPLAIAASKGFSNIVKLLLDHGASTEMRDIQGNTPIFESVRSNDEAMVRMFLDHRADLSIFNSRKESPLHYAAKSARLGELLLKAGSSPSPIDSVGMTPLHKAVECGNLRAVILLLKSKASPNCRTNDGVSPLFIALSQRHTITVNWLLRYGANAQSAAKDGDDTVLDFAVRTRYVPAVKMLVEHGADPERLDRTGESPLHRAATMGDYEIVKTFLMKGADPYLQNQSGETPVSRAVFHGRGPVVKLLVRCDRESLMRKYFETTPPHKWDEERARSHFRSKGLLASRVKHAALLK